MEHLFTPYHLGNLTLKNRLVMAPMCMYSAKDDGLVTDWHIHHYVTRSIGGIGLIVVEATGISPEGRITSNDLGIWSDEHIKGLKKLVNAVHEAGSKIGIQINHAGRKSKASGVQIEAPSAIAFDLDYDIPKEMSKEDIMQTVEEFKQAAVRANRAGFDMIQIHAAHGYLLSEFLSPLTNQRSDEYGGSPENRVRMLGEVVKAIRSEWVDKPLEVRVSAQDYADGGNEAGDLAYMLNLIKDYGIDSVNVSTGGVVSVMPKAFPLYQVPHARTIKELTGLPVVAGGLVLNTEDGQSIIENDDAQMVFLGRELLRNPYFPLNAMKELKMDELIPKQYKRAYMR